MPCLISQSELNHIVRDMNLSKDQAQLLRSKLQRYILLDEGTKVTVRFELLTVVSAVF
jgi:hypothetical protein